MTDQQFQQLVDLLGRLGSTTYQMAYRQVLIDGWMSAVGALLLLIVTIIFVLFTSRLLKSIAAERSAFVPNVYDQRKKYDVVLDSGNSFMLLIFCIIAGMISGGFGIGALFTAISLFANPQWAPIQAALAAQEMI